MLLERRKKRGYIFGSEHGNGIRFLNCNARNKMGKYALKILVGNYFLLEIL